MISFNAQLYRGNSSERHTVTLQVDDLGLVHFPGELDESPRPFSAFSVSQRLGNTPRTLTLPDGYRIETDDNEEIDRLVKTFHPTNRDGWLHRLESRFRYIVVSLLLVATCTWGFIGYGLPYLSKKAAFALPADILHNVGEQALAQLDEMLLQPSQLPDEQRAQIARRFQSLLQILGQTDQGYRLEFRSGGPLGANALALPSGVVVVTDELVRLAAEPAELDSVLAHEVGHLELRHGLRRAIQSSVLPLLILAVTGDVSSASSLIAALPTLVLEAGYSQAFEREADRYAIDYLDEQGLSRHAFARMLERLEAGHDSSFPGFLSTHPSTEERIQSLKRG